MNSEETLDKEVDDDLQKITGAHSSHWPIRNKPAIFYVNYGVIPNATLKLSREIDGHPPEVIEGKYFQLLRKIQGENITFCQRKNLPFRLYTETANYSLQDFPGDDWDLFSLFIYDCTLFVGHRVKSIIDLEWFLIDKINCSWKPEEQALLTFPVANKTIINEKTPSSGTFEITKSLIEREIFVPTLINQNWTQASNKKIGEARFIYRKFYTETEEGQIQALEPEAPRFDKLDYWVEKKE